MAKKNEVTQEQAQVQEQTAKQPEEKPAVNYADIIRDSLMKTNRDSIVDLLDYMKEIGFWKPLAVVETIWRRKVGLLNIP